MCFCLKNLWQYLPTAAATPTRPLTCCPCMASCRFQRRPFCCVCKPFFVPGVARSTRRRLQFAFAPFSLMPGPEQRLLPPPNTSCCSAPSSYSFTSPSLSSPSTYSCHCRAPFSLILWEFSAAKPPAAPLPLSPPLPIYHSPSSHTSYSSLPFPLCHTFTTLLCLFNLPKNVHCARFTRCKKRAGGY